jgi:hypothetical protein
VIAELPDGGTLNGPKVFGRARRADLRNIELDARRQDDGVSEEECFTNVEQGQRRGESVHAVGHEAFDDSLILVVGEPEDHNPT